MFHGADVAVRALRTRDAALVEVVDRIRGADGVDPSVDGRAALAQRHGPGKATVV
ncbi:MAG: hypothetical protein KDH90_25530 [Anaerolineae bacterium]|nr:hypothetical protein [Anaerolineae bacterium]